MTNGVRKASVLSKSRLRDAPRNVGDLSRGGPTFNLHPFAAPLTDVDNVEAKFDLAMRSNKWEGEDEEEDVKVMRFPVARATREPSYASRVRFTHLTYIANTCFPYRTPCPVDYQLSWVPLLSYASFVRTTCDYLEIVVIAREKQMRNLLMMHLRGHSNENQKEITGSFIHLLDNPSKSMYFLLYTSVVFGKINCMWKWTSKIYLRIDIECIFFLIFIVFQYFLSLNVLHKIFNHMDS